MSATSCRKGPRFRLRAPCVEVLVDLPDLVLAADRSGIRVSLRTPQAGGSITLHLLLDDSATGRRLADWWPATGKAAPSLMLDRCATLGTWREVLALAVAERREAAV